MRNKKQYRIDLGLFVGSVVVLIYIFFAGYANANEWDHSGMMSILDWLTIPFILLGCVIPVIVVYRFISKKTDSRTLSMMAVLLSLLTGILINYMTLI